MVNFKYKVDNLFVKINKNTFLKKTDSVFNFIFYIICYYRSRFIILFFILFYSAVSISLQSYTVKLILQAYELEASIPSVSKPVMYYIVIMFLFNLNGRCYDYLSLKFYPEIKSTVTASAMEIIFQREYSFFQNNVSGEIASKIRDLSHGTCEVIRILTDRFLGFILTLSIASFTLAKIHSSLCLILVSYAVFIMSISFLFRKKIYMLSKKLSQSNGQLNGTIIEQLTNVLNIRLFNSLENEQKRIILNLEASKKGEKNLRWFVSKIMMAQGFMTVLMVAGCLLILTSSMGSHSITIGDFGLVLTMVFSITGIILSFSQDIPIFFEYLGQVVQGLELVWYKKPIKNPICSKPIIVEKGRIEFKKVNFNYPNSPILFKDKSITIFEGEKLGVVGYTGSGKSTFLNLILRLFDVYSGKILIDGQDISNVTQESLYESIAVIPQEIILFNRTILENIHYGKPNATLDEVMSASRKAQCHGFITSLPLGYSTVVGERGIKLSGGEKQRIAIARTILKNSPILLLDEATSAMDSLTEILIKKSLYELMIGKTVVAIAHRLSTLLNMDRIIVFDQGEIVEDGSHDELFNRKGLYRKLWDSQVDGFLHYKEILTVL